MVGLVPTIHVFASLIKLGVQDVDARHKGEHEALENRRGHGFRFAVPRRPGMTNPLQFFSSEFIPSVSRLSEPRTLLRSVELGWSS
jgi:hypothetical protein